MRGLVIDKVAGEPGDVLRARGAAVQFKATFDQPARARANHSARGMQRNRGQTLAVENEVERVDQVGRRIHQRAVKIEYNSAGKGHREIAIGPRAIMQVGTIDCCYTYRKWGQSCE